MAHFSSTSIYIHVMPSKLQNVNISKTMTPFVNAAVNEALRLVPFFHNGLFQLIDCSKFSVMVDLLLKSDPNSIIHGV